MIWVLSSSHIIQPQVSEFWPQIYALVAIPLKYWWWQPGLVIFFFYTKPSFTKNTAKESKHIWNTWKMRRVMCRYSRLIAKPTGLSITALLIVSSICLSADQKWIDYFKRFFFFNKSVNFCCIWLLMLL